MGEGGPRPLVLVESHDRFDVVGEFDHDTGQLEEFSRSASADRLQARRPVQGHFAFLGATLAVLYRYDGVLWLRLGAHRRMVGDAAAPVVWERIGAEARLSMPDEDGRQIEARYFPGPHRGPSLAEDPTAFASSEDWDFGLLVSNVVTDDSRRRLIYATDTED
jgi:hypothetical protein